MHFSISVANETLTIAILNSLSKLLRLRSLELLPFQLELSKELLTRNTSALHRALGPGNNARSSCAVKLLCCMIRDANETGWTLRSRKAWTILATDVKNIIRLLGVRIKKETSSPKADTRTLVISFLLNLLKNGASNLKAEILGSKGLFTALLSGLKEDSAEVTRNVLFTLASHVLADQKLKLGPRLHAVDASWAVSVELLANEGKKGAVAQYLNFSIDHISQIREPAALRSLTSLLGCFKVVDSPTHAPFVRLLLEKQPDLFHTYWNKAYAALEPKASTKWVSTICQACEAVGIPMDAERLKLASGATLVDASLPAVFTKVWWSKALQHENPIIVHLVSLLLITCLRKVAHLALRLGDRQERLLRDVATRLPDPQLIVAAVQKQQVEPFKVIDPMRLLVLYYEVAPALVAQTRFDLVKLSAELLASEDAENIPAQFSVLALLPHTLSHSNWLKGDPSTSGIQLLLRLSIQSTSADLRAAARSSVRLILQQSAVFEKDDSTEIDIWITVITGSSTELQAFWIECVQKANSLPFRYLEVTDLVYSKSGLDIVPNALVGAWMEQCKHKAGGALAAELESASITVALLLAAYHGDLEVAKTLLASLAEYFSEGQQIIEVQETLQQATSSKPVAATKLLLARIDGVLQQSLAAELKCYLLSTVLAKASPKSSAKLAALLVGQFGLLAPRAVDALLQSQPMCKLLTLGKLETDSAATLMSSMAALLRTASTEASTKVFQLLLAKCAADPTRLLQLAPFLSVPSFSPFLPACIELVLDQVMAGKPQDPQIVRGLFQAVPSSFSMEFRQDQLLALSTLYTSSHISGVSELLAQSVWTRRSMLLPLTGSNAFHLPWIEAVWQHQPEDAPWSYRVLRALLARSQSVQEAFERWLSTSPHLSAPMYDVLVTFLQINSAVALSLMPAMTEQLVQKAFGGLAAAQTVAARLATRNTSAVVEAASEVLAKVQPASVNHHHFDTALAILLSEADETLSAALLEKALLWLVRRFAEDEEHRVETNLLVISMNRYLGSVKATLKPHLVEPVIEAAIAKKLEQVDVLMLMASLLERTPQNSNTLRLCATFLASPLLDILLSKDDLRTPAVALMTRFNTLLPENIVLLNAMLAAYDGTLAPSDQQLKARLRAAECKGIYPLSRHMANWCPRQLASHGLRGCHVLAVMDADAVLQGCLDALRPLTVGTPTLFAYDAELILSLLAAYLSEDAIEVLEFLELVRHHIVGIALCALASPQPPLQRMADRLLARLRNRLQGAEFIELDEVLLLLDHAANVSGPHNSLSALFLTYAMHAVGVPSETLYPTFMRHCLQRSIYDAGDVPLFYQLLYPQDEEGVAENRDWLLDFLAQTMCQPEAWVVLRRRQTVDLVLGLANSGIASASVKGKALEVLSAASRFDVAATDLVRRFAVFSLAQQQIDATPAECAVWAQILDNTVRHLLPGQLSKKMQALWPLDALAAFLALHASGPSSLDHLKTLRRIALCAIKADMGAHEKALFYSQLAYAVLRVEPDGLEVAADVFLRSAKDAGEREQLLLLGRLDEFLFPAASILELERGLPA